MTERVEPVRVIAAVTGSRADYALLRPVLRAIEQHPRLRLRLCVTGSHLSERHGSTVKEIEADGFSHFARIPLDQSGDSAREVTRAHARAVEGFGNLFVDEKPDALLCLGDRFEIHGAATAAWIARVPIAHLHGGEVTEGSLDEAFRHGISKMSAWHFVSSEAHAQRLRQLGEAPDAIFLVGLTACDAIAETPLPSREEVRTRLSLPSDARWLLVTYHPETTHPESDRLALAAIAGAIDAFPNHHVVITHPNADTGYEEVLAFWERRRNRDPRRVRLVASLGSAYYLAALRDADLCLGNSSSGVVEAPIFETPALQIGNRQRGRARPSSIETGASDRIVAHLARLVGQVPRDKRFHDWSL